MVWWKTDSSPERALPNLILTPGSDEIKFLFYGHSKKKKIGLVLRDQSLLGRDLLFSSSVFQM